MTLVPHQGHGAATQRVRAPGTRTAARSFENCRTVETMVFVKKEFTRELRQVDPTTSLTRCDHAVMLENKCIAAWLDNAALACARST